MSNYRQIAEGVYYSHSRELCETLTTKTLRKESKLTGVAVGLIRGKLGLQVVCAFQNPHKLAICWTKLNLESPDTCEYMAGYIEAIVGKEGMSKKIMSLCYQVLEMIHKPAICWLMGLDMKKYPMETDYKAMQAFLNSGKGEEYNAVLELITK